MPTVHGDIYIVDFEGLAHADGQARYCSGTLSYATSRYNEGLAEPPRGSGTNWNPIEGKASSGRFTITLRPGFGPIDWMKAELTPTTYTKEPLDDSETAIDITGLTADSAIDVGYINRETVKVSSETPPSVLNTVAGRGYAGSTAVEHTIGAGIFEDPPALIGRKVTVSRVAHDGSGTGDETVVQAGYITSEPVDKGDVITLDCQEWWPGWEVNRDLRPVKIMWSGSASQLWFDTRDSPRFHDDGGFWFIPKLKVVVKARWNSTLWQGPETGTVIVWQDDPNTLPELNTHYDGYEIGYSDDDAGYPPFGYKPDGGVWTASTNPVDILLNILVSFDDTNFTTDDTNWDNGILYPHLAFGIPIADIDIETFRQAREELNAVRARRLWIGGNKTESITKVARRLLGIWGYSLILQRDGQWSLARFKDVYPGDTTQALTNANSGGDITQSIMSRPTDRILIELNDGPDRSKRDIISVQEVTARKFYPEWQSSSAELKFTDVPYAIQDFDESSTAYALLASVLSRLSGRISKLRGLHIGSSMLDNMDAGAGVTVHDLQLRDPQTGDRLVAADSALKGAIAQVSGIDHYSRSADLLIYLTGNNNVARIAPSAVIVSWSDFPNYTATVTEHAYSLDTNPLGDAEYFSAGDYCMLLDSHGAPRSNDGAANKWEVSSVTATTIDFVGPPKSGAVGFLPNAGDIIVFTKYDNVQSSQIGTYAVAADDAPPDLSYVSGDLAPYVYGD